jgi:prepilin-type N-terminal cleavage/methylation domain-containing protein
MIREIIRKQSGFSLVELIITMTVFVMAIAAATSIFVPMLTQFKQQSKIAESQVERLVGLDILRRDLEQAGFGLPWVIPAAVNYQETISDMATGWVERDYNDGPPNNPARHDELGDPACNPPAAIRNGNNVAGALNNSDVLIIKSTSIATNDAASKWTYVTGAAGGGQLVNMWGSSLEDLNNGERVIVMIPMRGETNQRILVVDNAGNFSVQFNDAGLPSAYAPSTERDVFLVYGVDPDTNLRMPFNRADYYVERPAGAGEMPPRCAQNTGILYKGVVNNRTDAGGGEKTPIRLLECVADMQLIFGWDADEDGNFEHPGIIPGSADVWLEDLNIYTAAEIREHLKEVRVYILAHEGQRDSGYDFDGFTGGCATCVRVGEFGLGRDIDLAAVIPDYQEYRWKVYMVIVKPANLRET